MNIKTLAARALLTAVVVAFWIMLASGVLLLLAAPIWMIAEGRAVGWVLAAILYGIPLIGAAAVWAAHTLESA